MIKHSVVEFKVIFFKSIKMHLNQIKSLIEVNQLSNEDLTFSGKT